MRVPSLVLATLAPFLAGCSVFDPGATVSGSWGGHWIHLDAREEPPRLIFPCVEAAFVRPLVADGDGRFEGMARITLRSGPPYRTDDGFGVSGEIRGSQMVVHVTYTSPRYTSPEPQVFSLRRGAEPDFSGVACLA